jgi:bla regulator protein BlaR1
LDILTNIFVHVCLASLAASFIIMLIFLMKHFLGDRLSARLYHMIWILVLIRLVMPFEVYSPYNITNIFPEVYQIMDYSQEEIGSDQASNDNRAPNYAYTGQVESNQQTALDSFKIIPVLSAIWFMGCLIVAGFYAHVALRFRLKSKQFTRINDPAITAMVQRSCARLGIKKTIPVYINTYFSIPCITGIFSPRIYLPQNVLEQIQSHQLEHVLLHELAHYKRKDLIFSMWAAIAVIIHWFNPLVWLAIREMRYDREVAADLYVMESLGPSAIIPYGTTLIKLASLLPKRPVPLHLAGFSGTKTSLERRIHMIKSFQEGSYRIPVLTVIIVILLGTLTLSLTSCATQSADSLLDANAADAIDPSLKGQVVFIDPGHGGTDDGAVYSPPESPEVKEKELNLAIALRLAELLEQSGIQVVMTRQDDSTVQLDERIDMVNSSQAALLVSIHQDFAPDETANGTTTYYYLSDNMPAKEVTSEKAAQVLQANLMQHLDTQDRGTRTAKLRMLSDTQIPAVMTNIAYLSNESDREKLLTADFQNNAAQALYEGIIEVLKGMELNKD